MTNSERPADVWVTAFAANSPVAPAFLSYRSAVADGTALAADLQAAVCNRIRTLLGAPVPPSVPNGSTTAAADVAVLEFVEQWMLDPSEMTDEQCAAVRARLGDAGAAALTYLVSVTEAATRTELALAGLR